MPSFIEDLARQVATVFHPDLDEAHGKRTVGTPFPEGLILTKSNTPDEGEVNRNIVRGYQRLSSKPCQGSGLRRGLGSTVKNMSFFFSAIDFLAQVHRV